MPFLLLSPKMTIDSPQSKNIRVRYRVIVLVFVFTLHSTTKHTKGTNTFNRSHYYPLWKTDLIRLLQRVKDVGTQGREPTSKSTKTMVVLEETGDTKILLRLNQKGKGESTLYCQLHKLLLTTSIHTVKRKLYL